MSTIIPEIDLEREYTGRYTASRALYDSVRAAAAALDAMREAGISDGAVAAVALALVGRIETEFGPEIGERKARALALDVLIDRRWTV